MIWLVWNIDEREAAAKRIDAQDCIEAAERWAERVGQVAHTSRDLYLRMDGDSVWYRVTVKAEPIVHYSAKVKSQSTYVPFVAVFGGP